MSFEWTLFFQLLRAFFLIAGVMSLIVSHHHKEKFEEANNQVDSVIMFALLVSGWACLTLTVLLP